MTRARRLRAAILGALVATAAPYGPRTATGGDAAGHDAHCTAAAPARYERSLGRYDVPAVTLRNQENQPVPLASLLGERGGVALGFIFTSCNTICPVMTATFSRLRAELGDDASAFRLVSISIDPDHDTPTVLKDYARRFGIAPEWQLLTGDDGDVVRVQKAFDAYRGAKTNHQPVVFLRAAGRPEWVRINGFASAADLAGEYRRLLAE